MTCQKLVSYYTLRPTGFVSVFGLNDRYFRDGYSGDHKVAERLARHGFEYSTAFPTWEWPTPRKVTPCPGEAVTKLLLDGGHELSKWTMFTNSRTSHGMAAFSRKEDLLLFKLLVPVETWAPDNRKYNGTR